ncbi:MAG: leucine-rich repeat domain-containing protein [Intestinimonas sp.]|nr:leucine-rich repeat domain-containing protein [Intestinimonas sp.]
MGKAKQRGRPHKKRYHAGPFVFQAPNRPAIPEEMLQELNDPANFKETLTGTCGENVQWRLEINQDKTVMYLTGSGPMYPYTKLGDNPPWGMNQHGITEIHMDDAITHLGTFLFPECWNLTTLHLPAQLVSIGEGAFSGCRSLVLASLPDTLIHIGDGAFSGCKHLALTSLPESLVCIEGAAFRGCTDLALDHLPPNLEYIGTEAFANCPKLKLHQLPAKLVYSGRCAFTGCPQVFLP